MLKVIKRKHCIFIRFGGRVLFPPHDGEKEKKKEKKKTKWNETKIPEFSKKQQAKVFYCSKISSAINPA